MWGPGHRPVTKAAIPLRAPSASPKVTGLLCKTARVADHEEALGCVCRAGLATRLKEQRLTLWSLTAPGKEPRAWLNIDADIFFILPYSLQSVYPFY